MYIVYILYHFFQVQYVRLVSTPSTGSTNVVTVGKSKASTTLQTVGIGQKIGNQQQIVKVYKNSIILIMFLARHREKEFIVFVVFFIFNRKFH